MRSKRKILIIYPYAWLAYAPTVLRLYDALTSSFDVAIVAFEDESFCKTKVERPGISYYRLPTCLSSLAEKLAKRYPEREKRWHFFHIVRAFFFWLVLRLHRADEVIATDNSGAWIAQKVFRWRKTRLHFLSLELYECDFFASRIQVDRFASVMIQTPDRLDWLFPRHKPRVFYIQNAPVFKRRNLPQKRGGLVYCGTALPRFGIFTMLELLLAYPQLTLTLQGLSNEQTEAILRPHNELIEQGRLILHNHYFASEASLLDWLGQFKVGLCLYDFGNLPADHFNYQTVPSGKIFNYLAAGVPIVGNDMPGLSPVKEFNAGVLIQNHSPATVKAAIDKIEDDLLTISENCLRAAEHYSFDKAVEPFSNLLLERQSIRS